MELSMMTFMLEFPVLFIKEGSKEKKVKEIETFVELTAKTGYKKIDMILQTIQLAGKEEIKRMLNTNGLTLNCIIYMGIAENDESTPEVVEIAEYFGCKKIMLVPGQTDEKRSKSFDRMVEVYTKVVNLAAEKGMVCVIEDDPNIKIPMSTREELDALLNAVPGLRVVYDSANMLPVGEDPVSYYEYFADRTSHIHIKDMQIADIHPEGYANPGTDGRFYINAPHKTGVVDFEALFAAIKKSGYNDTLAIEYVPMQGCTLEEDFKRVYDIFEKLI